MAHDPGAPLGGCNLDTAPLLWFPNHGQINALVVFIQRKEDEYNHCGDRYDRDSITDEPAHVPYGPTNCGATPGEDGPQYESYTDDPETEWPARRLVSGQMVKTLPDWHDEFIDAPGTAPANYTEGSLSDYYWTMSQGTFRLEGLVYPELYVPLLDTEDYDGHSGVSWSDYHAISQEVITYIDQNQHGIDFSQFDRYVNGTNTYGADGVFDMIILAYRSGRAIADFGTGAPYGASCGDPDYDAFPTPLYIDGLRVQDNVRYGSGVIVSANWTRHRAISLAAHEIGHRQLSVHTYASGGNQNNFSVMGNHHWFAMSASDRVNLGWMTPQVLTLGAFSRYQETLGDAFETGDALLIKETSSDVGTILVEARSGDSYWNGGFDLDGDWDDSIYIVEEGLLVYKKDGAGSYAEFYDSMDNTGSTNHTKKYWTLPGDPHVAFRVGDSYTPLSAYRFSFPANPNANPALDTRIGLTDVSQLGNTFSFTVWDDFLEDDAAPKVLRTNYTLSDESLARTDDWTFGGEIRFDAGFDAPPTATDPSITLLPNARFVVPVGVGAKLFGESGDRFPFTAGAGAQVRIEGASSVGNLLPGTFRTEHVAFEAADANGWLGLYFGSGAYGRLYDTRVEDVLWPLTGLASAAVTAYDADLLVDDASWITGANVDGLLAVGGDVTVTGASEIFENAGYGIAVSAGASVTVEGGASVEQNHSGGVKGTGYGTVVTFGSSLIFNNDGPGVHVTAGASGYFEPAAVTANVVQVGGNEGGVSATGGGFLNAGMCDRPGCTHMPHQILQNALGGHFDARSLTGSTLFAQGDFWGFGVDDPSDLVLVQDLSSFLSVTPIATTPGVPFAGGTAGGSAGRMSGGRAARGSGQTAVALIAEAERALADFDTTAAASLVVDALTGVALDPSATEDDRRAAFEGAGRFLALTQPAGVVGWLSERAGEEGALRPWALRALVVARAEAGETAAAEAAASSLTSENPEGEHALKGHGHLVRLAVVAEDEAGALARLGAMAAAFPEAEATAQAAAIVAAAFPDADVDGALNGPSGRLAEAASGAAQASASATGTPAAFAVAEVRPNPVGAASGRVEVPVSLPAEARVEAVLYDVLGRRLGLIHAGALGAGEHTLALNASGLPSGVYVVHVTAHGSDDRPRVAVRQFTVAR